MIQLDRIKEYDSKAERVCKICHTAFFTYVSRLRQGRGNFCSVRCKNIHQANNKKFAENVKKAIIKLYRSDPDYRIRISIATKKAMDNPAVRNKLRLAGLGRKPANYKGSMKHSAGYLFIHNPQHPFANRYGYVLEHRLVVEKQIGRLLEPDEVVHHKNHNKSDNRITNLLLFKNQGTHMAYHIGGVK
jgi:hypothetical protein